MKLKKVLDMIDNGEYLNEKEYLEVLGRIEQIKIKLNVDTLYVAVEYVSNAIDIYCIFEDFDSLQDFITNQDEETIIRVIEK